MAAGKGAAMAEYEDVKPALLPEGAARVRHYVRKAAASLPRSPGELRQWAKQGGTLRTAGLILATGILSIAVSAITAFLLLVLAATANAVVISFVLCLSAVGAFLAMFLASVSAISVAAFFASAAFVGTVALISAFTACCAGFVLTMVWLAVTAVNGSIKMVQKTSESLQQSPILSSAISPEIVQLKPIDSIDSNFVEPVLVKAQPVFVEQVLAPTLAQAQEA
eukprot:jgi/Chlat1/403/Chrsp10S01504